MEADECYQSAGSKGLPREVERHDCAPRPRGLYADRATAERAVHLLGLVQRRDKTDPDAPAAQIYLAVLENVRTATIKPLIAAKVKGGAQFFTDEDNIYHFTAADYDHRTVNHGAGEYARHDPDGGVHAATRWKACGPACAISWTASKGISQRFLHLRSRTLRFLHNHGHWPWRQTFEATLRSIFSTTGDYLRQMAHHLTYTTNALLPMSVGQNQNG